MDSLLAWLDQHEAGVTAAATIMLGSITAAATVVLAVMTRRLHEVTQRQAAIAEKQASIAERQLAAEQKERERRALQLRTEATEAARSAIAAYRPAYSLLWDAVMVDQGRTTYLNISQATTDGDGPLPPACDLGWRQERQARRPVRRCAPAE